MIKRPVILIFISVVVGIILGETVRGWLYAIITVYCLFALLIIQFFKKHNNLRASYLKKDKIKGAVVFICVLPLIMAGAYARSKSYELRIANERHVYEELENKAITNVILEGTIKSYESDEDKLVVILKDCRVKATEEKSFTDSGDVRVYVSENEECLVKTGNEIRVYGSIKLYEHATNPGQFDSYEYNLKYGVYAYISAKELWITNERTNEYASLVSKLRLKMKETFQALYTAENAGVLTSMLIGDRSLMDEDTGFLYKNAGISHILAISGLHISLICMGFYTLMEKTAVPKHLRIILSAVFIAFFVMYAGMGISALRAGIMTFILLTSKLIRKHYDMLSSLSFAASIILIIYPHELKDASFILSVLAVTGVYVGEKLKAGMLSGCIITLVTLPAVLWFFFETSIYGPITNIVVLPICSALLIFGLMSGVLGMVSLPLGGMLAGVTHLILKFIGGVGKVISSLPYSYICTGRPSVWKVFIYYSAILGTFLVLYRKKDEEKNKIHPGALLKSIPVIFLAIVILCSPGKKSEMAFLDVGQGDSFVFLSGYESIVVDNGSSDRSSVGKYVLSPYLKYNGMTVIDYFIVTHTDDDHINGLKEILENMDRTSGNYGAHYKGNISVKNLILPTVRVKGKAYIELERLAEEKCVNVIYSKQGHSIETYDRKADFLCLAPKEAGKSENGTSLVYKLETHNYTVFLMGDADKKEEEAVIIELERINYKTEASKTVILKVGHHGSKTSSSQDFINYIRPDFSVISCGKNNRYGHPAQEIVERLTEMKSQIYCTMTNNAILVRKRTGRGHHPDG